MDTEAEACTDRVHRSRFGGRPLRRCRVVFGLQGLTFLSATEKVAYDDLEAEPLPRLATGCWTPGAGGAKHVEDV